MTSMKHITGKVIPVKDHVIVKDMEFGERITSGGVILPGDDRQERGIRARWAQVYAVGPTQTDIKEGQYVLIKHGRWTRGIDVTDNGTTVTIRRVDNEDILMVSDVPQQDDTAAMSK